MYQEGYNPSQYYVPQRDFQQNYQPFVQQWTGNQRRQFQNQAFQPENQYFDQYQQPNFGYAQNQQFEQLPNQSFNFQNQTGMVIENFNVQNQTGMEILQNTIMRHPPPPLSGMIRNSQISHRSTLRPGFVGQSKTHSFPIPASSQGAIAETTDFSRQPNSIGTVDLLNPQRQQRNIKFISKSLMLSKMRQMDRDQAHQLGVNFNFQNREQVPTVDLTKENSNFQPPEVEMNGIQEATPQKVSQNEHISIKKRLNLATRLKPTKTPNQHESEEDSWKSKSFSEKSPSRDPNDDDSIESGQIPDTNLKKKFEDLPGKNDAAKHKSRMAEITSNKAEIFRRLKETMSKKKPSAEPKVPSKDATPRAALRPIYRTQLRSNPAAPKSQSDAILIFQDWSPSKGDEQTRIDNSPEPMYFDLKKNEILEVLSKSPHGENSRSWLRIRYKRFLDQRRRTLSKMDSPIREKLFNVLANEEKICACLQMCPEQEADTRRSMKELDYYELESTSPILHPIKKFKRPAAGEVLNDPSDVRPPMILLKTVEHLISSVLHLIDDKSIEKIFNFINDRFRGVCQDFNIVFGEKDESSAVDADLFRAFPESINAFETMAKFYIVILNDTRFRPEFDESSVLHSLSAVLATLIESYHQARRLKNEFQAELKLAHKTRTARRTERLHPRQHCENPADHNAHLLPILERQIRVRDRRWQSSELLPRDYQRARF